MLNHEKNEVTKWNLEKGCQNKGGISVVGKNRCGDQRNQFNYPTYIFVNKVQSVPVSEEK